MALKVFAAEGAKRDFLRKRFVSEERLLARLDHPRLVKVRDLAVDDTTGAPYFTMDLVQSLPEPSSATDPCFSYAGTNRVSLIRLPFWSRWKAATVDFGEDWCPIWLVIGPKAN